MSSNKSKCKSGNGTGKLKEMPSSSEVQKTTPFGASLEDLKQEYKKIKDYIRYTLVAKHFSDIIIRKKFFSDDNIDNKYQVVEGIDLNGIMNFYNPFIQDVELPSWLCSEYVKHKRFNAEKKIIEEFEELAVSECSKQQKLICWFMGFEFRDENWINASYFEEKNIKTNKMEKTFDLSVSIFGYMKHRFNEAIRKEDSKSRIFTKNIFLVPEITESNIPPTNTYSRLVPISDDVNFIPKIDELSFNTLVSLNLADFDLKNQNVDKVIDNINSKITEVEKTESESYEAEKAAYKVYKLKKDLYKKAQIDKYYKNLTTYYEIIKNIYADTDVKLLPIDPLLIMTYAEFYYDIVHSGQIVLDSGKKLYCTAEDIQKDLWRNLGVGQVPSYCLLKNKKLWGSGWNVEKQMENGAQLKPEEAVKIASSNVEIGECCV